MMYLNQSIPVYKTQLQTKIRKSWMTILQFWWAILFIPFFPGIALSHATDPTEGPAPSVALPTAQNNQFAVPFSGTPSYNFVKLLSSDFTYYNIQVDNRGRIYTLKEKYPLNDHENRKVEMFQLESCTGVDIGKKFREENGENQSYYFADLAISKDRNEVYGLLHGESTFYIGYDVLKYNHQSGSWNGVGFGSRSGGFKKLVLDNNNTPYIIAYNPGGENIICKVEGHGYWVPIWTESRSGKQIDEIAFDSKNNLYVTIGNAIYFGTPNGEGYIDQDHMTELGRFQDQNGNDAQSLKIVVDNNDFLWVHGGFSIINETIQANSFAQWDGNNWLEASNGIKYVGQWGKIGEMKMGPDGVLYIGGEFIFKSGSRRNQIGIWDGNQWEIICITGNNEISTFDWIGRFGQMIVGGPNHLSIVSPMANVPRIWMRFIDDDTPISSLSIPGSHDSGADKYNDLSGCIGFPGLYAWAHTMDITHQLNSGIRFLDIRCKILKFQNILGIYHGMCYMDKTYVSVLNDCLKFLSENPSETILMRVKHEDYDKKKDGPHPDFLALIKKSIELSPDFWYLDSNRLPSLKEVRGKIILLDDCNFGQGIPYGDTLFMNIQDKFKPDFEKEAGAQQKWRFIQDQLIEAEKAFISCSGEDQRLFLNYISANDLEASFSSIIKMMTLDSYYPLKYAEFLNPKVNDRIERINEYIFDGSVSKRQLKYTKVRHGVIIMDFPPQSLIDEIITSNNIPLLSKNHFKAD
ncbi:MAG: phosphatidylinositol-specific phospholipase C [Saprospiraceae bacterium]